MNGIIQKTHSKSWFDSFGMQSPMGKQYFGKDSKYVILQILLRGNDHCVAEVILKADYKEETK